MSESTTSVKSNNTDKSNNTVKPDNTVKPVKPYNTVELVKSDKSNNTVEPTSLSPSNINWTPIDMPPRISAVGAGESQESTSNSTSHPTSDDTALNQSDNTAAVKPQSVPNKLSIGYMSLYPLLCVVMNLAFVVMMMLDIRAFQRYNALCVSVWVFTIISVVYALAIGWIAINDDIKTRRNNNKTDKVDKQDNNPVETNVDHHMTNNTTTQNDTIIQKTTQTNTDMTMSDVVRVETVTSKYDEPLIIDADNLTFDKTLDTKQVLHLANKSPFEPVEPTEETANKTKMPHVPAVPAVIIKKHDEPMTQHVPNTASVHDNTGEAGDTGDSDGRHDDDAKANQPQPASTDTSNNTNDATVDAHDDADVDVIKRIESDPDIIAVEQRIINQTEPPQGTPLREVRKEIGDALAAKTENHAATASNNEQDDADTSDKQTPSVPDGPTYTFDVD